MRRVLLASMSGAAVTAIRMEGIEHEFAAIPGVEQDMTDVVLNFKKCDLSLSEGDSVIFSAHFEGPGDCTVTVCGELVDCTSVGSKATVD